MPKKNGSFTGALGAKVDLAALYGSKLDRDAIKQGLMTELRHCFLLLSEIMQNEQLQDALVEVYWKRYEEKYGEYQAKKAQQEPELDLNHVTDPIIDPNRVR